MTDPVDLVVWRHGRTAWNDAGRFQGHADTPLDDVGHAQSKAAARALSLLGPSLVVSSDLARAASTAAYLGLPVTLDARLREVDVGEWSGLSRAEIEDRFPETYAGWLAGADVRHEGGESVDDVATRALAAVSAHLAAVPPGGPLVVVSHGGTSRALVLALLGLPVSARPLLGALGNARWAALVRRNGGWRLVAYNTGVDPEPDDATPTEPVL
ncbi:MAG: glucosyl-3-phosphoglycerate phosphatase [Frankiaceae bacterium]|nr:glucosyl-3-phosphoglycerate phosphatase [Frankiaceae bacterium]